MDPAKRACHEGTTQQPDARLLLDLPAPAMDRVLQLASSTNDPAIRAVSHVSKALKAAAEKAAAHVTLHIREPPMPARSLPFSKSAAAGSSERRIKLPNLPFMRRMSAPKVQPDIRRDWLGSHAQSVQELTVDGEEGDAWLQAMTSGVAAAAGEGTTALLLESLFLRRVWATPTLFSNLAQFQQLRLLVLGPVGRRDVDGAELLQALSHLTRLQQLALDLSHKAYNITGNQLLQALPPSLEAADVELRGPACISSSLAHLVRLASLKLKGTEIVSDPQAAGELQQVAGSLAAFSSSPDASNWFAAPSLKTAEIFIGPRSEAALARLSSCAGLHTLRVQYSNHIPDHTGVSAVTQITALRIEAVRLKEDAIINTSFCDEFQFLKQLQQLELPYALLNPTQARQWLPLLGNLEQLVLLVQPEECLEGLEEGMPVLSEVLAECRSSSLASSIAPPAAATSGSGALVLSAAPTSSSSALVPQAEACKLQRLQLALWLADSLEYVFASEAAAHAYSQLQVVAADLAAELPWLEVTCKRDAYSGPCWAAPPPVPPPKSKKEQEEEQLG